jgi:hypothetical protein
MKMIKYFRTFLILVFAGVLVACSSSSDSTYTLGVQVEGLNDKSLVLHNSNGDLLADENDGHFTFPTSLKEGSPYHITIKKHPMGTSLQCGLSNNIGIVNSNNAHDIRVSCITPVSKVPNIVSQFLSINGSDGYPFTFRYWNDDEELCAGINNAASGCFIGDDPTMTKHYQGMNRIHAGGKSYIYLNKNGNPFTSGTDYPGEILIVEMGARNSTGEELETDYTGTNYGTRQALADDHTVNSIHLIPGDLGAGVDWKHPGSGQQVGDLLFIPVEKTCSYEPENGKCGSHEEDRGAILVLKLFDELDEDVSPVNPKKMCQIEYYWSTNISSVAQVPKIGTLAAFKINDKYLFAHTTGGSYKKETALTFYEVPENELCTPAPGTSVPLAQKIFTWNADWLQDINGGAKGESEWRREGWAGAYRKKLDWQMINFVEDTNDDLYLIGTDKSATKAGVIVTPYDDYAKLFKIERVNNNFTVKYIAKKHLYLDDTPVDMGSLDAVGGLYVSPKGRLILYTAGHDNKWPEFLYGEPPDIAECSGDDRCKGLEMGEFASTITIETPIETLQRICDELNEIASNSGTDPAISIYTLKAAGNLCGNNEGEAANGAVDMLLKDNMNAAFVKLLKVNEYLALADAIDDSDDIYSYSQSVAHAARDICQEFIEQAEAVATKDNELIKIQLAKDTFITANSYLSNGEFVPAVEHYLLSVRQAQGIH